MDGISGHIHRKKTTYNLFHSDARLNLQPPIIVNPYSTVYTNIVFISLFRHKDKGRLVVSCVTSYVITIGHLYICVEPIDEN